MTLDVARSGMLKSVGHSSPLWTTTIRVQRQKNKAISPVPRFVQSKKAEPSAGKSPPLSTLKCTQSTSLANDDNIMEHSPSAKDRSISSLDTNVHNSDAVSSGVGERLPNVHETFSRNYSGSLYVFNNHLNHR